MAADSPAPAEYKLSQELLPMHEGGVQACCVLDDGTIVSGADDRVVKIWPKTPTGYGDPVYCVGFGGMVRALTPLPALSSFPEGGFAVGALDNNVSLFSKGGALVRTLSGHAGGVVDLGWTASGELLSGSWDGTAKLWDVESGTCVGTLDGHENAVCVLGLSNGDVVTGSTGKNINNNHVGFKVRIWRGGAVVKTLEDHDQAVRSLEEVPGIGFVSTSNDGTAKVRSLDGTVLATLANPPAGDKLSTCYRVVWVPDTDGVDGAGQLVTANEDTLLRVYRDNTLVQEVPHPGTPWTAAPLPNGDLVTVCNQAGTSSKGHVLIWTKDDSRVADGAALAAFAENMVPPETAGGGSAIGDTEDQMRPLGPYERRNTFVGKKPGALAYFTKSDGTLWICSWDADANSWQDIGEVQGVAGESIKYDVERTVTLDVPTGGVSTLDLKFNLSDDPGTVARTFIARNGLDISEFEQVRDFVMQERDRTAAQRGVSLTVATDDGGSGPAGAGLGSGASFGAGAGGGAAASAPPVATIPQTRHFPIRGYVSAANVKFDKALEKLVENNTAVAASNPSQALSDEEVTAARALAGVLKETSRYHASLLSEGMQAVVHKVVHWPPAMLLPALDIMRVVVTHPHGSEVFEGLGQPAVAAVIAAARSSDAPAAVQLLAPRLLFNCFQEMWTRRLVGSMLPDVLSLCSFLLSTPSKNVHTAVAFLLCNVSRFLVIQRGRAPEGEFESLYDTVVDRCTDVVLEALQLALDAAPLLRVLEAAGNLVLCGPLHAKHSKESGMEAAVNIAVGAHSEDASLKECREELLPLLKA